MDNQQKQQENQVKECEVAKDDEVICIGQTSASKRKLKQTKLNFTKVTAQPTPNKSAKVEDGIIGMKVRSPQNTNASARRPIDDADD